MGAFPPTTSWRRGRRNEDPRVPGEGHPAVVALRDPDEEDPREREAREHDLAYIALDGDIGCLVNGAGLAMATMDVIQAAGGRPANFLDVGGGADEARVAHAFKIILADPQVKAILVNIFGGIMRCDIIANGIVAAAKQVGIQVPLVVRLRGTNDALGREILEQSELRIIPASDLGEAAGKAVAAATQGRRNGARVADSRSRARRAS